jgi:hypothetical protein
MTKTIVVDELPGITGRGGHSPVDELLPTIVENMGKYVGFGPFGSTQQANNRRTTLIERGKKLNGMHVSATSRTLKGVDGYEDGIYVFATAVYGAWAPKPVAAL